MREAPACVCTSVWSVFPQERLLGNELDQSEALPVSGHPPALCSAPLLAPGREPPPHGFPAVVKGLGTFRGGFAKIVRYGEIFCVRVMLVKRRGLQPCLKPGRASAGTVPASHTVLLTRRRPDRQQPCCGERSGALRSPDFQIRVAGAVFACVRMTWTKFLRGVGLDHHHHSFLLTLARVWAPAVSGGNLCQGTGLSWYVCHAVLQTGDAREGVRPR